MHSHSLEQWTHAHNFLGREHHRNERRTLLVVGITAAMMIGEIVAGSVFGSMALLADGWHMATHAVALGIATIAYRFARQQTDNARFSFGTGKFGDLAAFSSAIILAMIAAQIVFESATRFTQPVPIAYNEAIAVAVLGLFVNLICVWLLRDSHDHHHGHHHDHPHDDNNLRAAYVHVLADAATSVLAIGALVLAMLFNWTWADPAVGLIGSLLIVKWAFSLVKDSGSVLLDVNANDKLAGVIRDRLEQNGDRITDLHLWQVGPGHQAAVISIVSDNPLAPAKYKRRLEGLQGLSHITIEVQACSSAA